MEGKKAEQAYPNGEDQGNVLLPEHPKLRLLSETERVHMGPAMCYYVLFCGCPP